MLNQSSESGYCQGALSHLLFHLQPTEHSLHAQIPGEDTEIRDDGAEYRDPGSCEGTEIQGEGTEIQGDVQASFRFREATSQTST